MGERIITLERHCAKLEEMHLEEYKRRRELEARVARLTELHERNVADARKFRRDTEGHRCGWRVALEAIEARSRQALAGKQPQELEDDTNTEGG